MKNILVLIAGLLISTFGFSQNENPKDPKAKAILDKVSQTNKSYSSMYVTFSFNLKNKTNGIDETQSGELWIKGEQYKLVTGTIERYSDGKTIWTYLTDDDECQITSAEDEDSDEESFSPSSIFTIYEKGFNYLYGSEVMIDGKKNHMIKLFPEGAGKPYHTVKIYVGSTTNQMNRIELFYKDGNTFTYTITEIKGNLEMADSSFKFDESKAGDVIDMR